MPKANWKELANLIHPKSADFQLPWFLDFIFGAKAPPADAMVKEINKQTNKNLFIIFIYFIYFIIFIYFIYLFICLF